MNKAIIQILEKFGLPTLFAVGVGAMLAWTMVNSSKERAIIAQQQSEERATHTALMIDQISDLREKVARLEGICTRR
jgi:hypothetical protein